MTSREVFTTEFGRAVEADSVLAIAAMESESVDLVMTSPPFDLQLAKEYGNLRGEAYLDWLEGVGAEVFRVLKSTGSLVLDLGGAWNRRSPTRNLYQFKALLRLVDNVGFFLAQDFYWWNPSRLPTPAEWVTIRRIRVKDAVNTIWWLSKTEYPKASNRRVLQPYSNAQHGLFKNGYQPKVRPSGHSISSTFGRNNGGSIPPNLLVVANTDSASQYIRYCRKHGLPPHPARFPTQIPEFFIRLLTDAGDEVVDPFAGSCATGEAAETLQRRWLCIDREPRYLEGGRGRFSRQAEEGQAKARNSDSYRVARVGQYAPAADASLKKPMDPSGGRTRDDDTE